MKITINTIPHRSQRYDTCGDWQFAENGDLAISVSDTGDWRYNALVGIHEAVEAILCQDRGIREEDVTAFDVEFENERDVVDDSEPGDNENAPYRQEHFFATTIERAIALELGVDWILYEQSILSLEDTSSDSGLKTDTQ